MSLIVGCGQSDIQKFSDYSKLFQDKSKLDGMIKMGSLSLTIGYDT